MKRLPLYTLLTLFAFSTTASLFGVEPILDLKVSDRGMVSDSSKVARKLKIEKGVEATGEASARLINGNAIEIPYSAGDPLFNDGACTYILRCKFGELFHATPYSVAGRWEYATNQRSISLSVGGQDGHLRFQVSATGKLDSNAGVVQKSPVPVEEWVEIVGRFEPGKAITCQLYSESGGLIDDRTNHKEIPAKMFDTPVRFVLGAPAAVKMEFSRLRVWNAALNEHEIKAALAEGK